MWRVMMKSKIHRATVTETNLNYVGSITIDRTLLRKADILPHEKVQVVNITNGNRFETYAIAGKEGSGTIALNGAAARLAHSGDTVIIISYGIYDREEAAAHRPVVVLVNETNQVTEVNTVEVPVETGP